ncbi:MAG: excinuclease ABC subunit UvrA, partial [Clostridia bacterium]
MDKIFIKGAKENNLKNIDVSIPRNKLVVFTGLSGSGKSSLAFDTIFAEGQRRYIESLSSYARQFLGQMEKPNVEYIEGLSPAVSIDQKTTSKNPRSTVGTVTEIYDYMRLLFARVGTPHCPKCGREITQQSVDQICDKIIDNVKTSGDNKIIILAPAVRGRKGEYNKMLNDFKKAGYIRVRVDGIDYTLDEEIELDKNVKHTISVTVDRLVIKDGIERRLTDSLETAIKLGDGLVIIDNNGHESLFSTKYNCPDCDISIEELEPRLFSFNNPYGACPDCTGLGFNNQIDLDMIIKDENLSINAGGISTPSGWNMDTSRITNAQFKALSKQYGFSLDVPIKDLPKSIMKILLYGTGERVSIDYNSQSFKGSFMTSYEGIVNNLLRRYRDTMSDAVKQEIEKYMKSVPCKTCNGKRLKKEALAVTVGGLNIAEISDMSIVKLDKFFNELLLDEQKTLIGKSIIKEIRARLNFLINVGLDYLTLSRTAATLSGGESQRIRLATQIGSGLTGVLYILDEPSIGLHQKDNARLLESLKGLRDLGNTLIVVEHDDETIRAADYVVDIGPGAGIHGGELVVSGTVDDVMACDKSYTGKYLKGELKIDVPESRRQPDGRYLSILGAKQNNLKNLDIK